LEWLAGNRIIGTTAERPSASLQSPSVGGWVEVGRTTLGGTSSSIDVSSLDDKRYYMILSDKKFTGNDGGTVVRYNADSGSNYAERFSNNGGSDYSYASIAHHTWGTANVANGGTQFTVGYVANLSSKEKLALSHSTDTNAGGAGSAPDRTEAIGKWTGSNAISAFSDRAYNGNSVIASGSEVVVLGWDPADSHTTNFWEPLASVDASGSSNTLSTSITSKKYLWIQGYTENTSGSVVPRVGNSSLDSGSNYATRLSSNGGSEDLSTSANGITGLTSTTPIFWNMFIINNASNEKLIICHVTRQNTAGAGNAPNRVEVVSKWVNTSNQIDIIGFVSTTGGSTINSNSSMKVWGSN
jgi:hypothetical protein